MAAHTLCEETLGTYFSGIAARFPKREALTFGPCRYTYAKADELSDRAARGLISAGFRRGMHLGILVRNRPNTVLLLLATLKLGIVTVLLGGKSSAAELDARLRQTDCNALLWEGTLPPAPLPCPMLELPVLYGLAKGISNEMLSAAKADVTPDDVDVILFTSGTTSTPKAVLSTHKARLTNALDLGAGMNTIPDDRFCTAIPISHCFSLTSGVLAALTKGACVCFTEDHHSKSILTVLENERCTVLHGVPTLFYALLERQRRERRDITLLRTGMIGGAGYTPERFAEIAAELDFDLLPSLGQTEATAGITLASPRDSARIKSQTVGRLLPGLEGRFISLASGEPLPIGSEGELCIRGYNVMCGYYKPPTDEADIVDAEGFLHTGDLGRFDEAGNITLTGRRKELIIRGGENISPAEIERLLCGFEGVRTAKVIGVPHTHFGEAVCACVEAEANIGVTQESLRAQLAGVLPPYKVPEHILFFTKLPTTDSGKIRLEALRSQALTRLSIEGENAHAL